MVSMRGQKVVEALQEPLSVVSVCDRRLHHRTSNGAHRDAATEFMVPMCNKIAMEATREPVRGRFVPASQVGTSRPHSWFMVPTHVDG
jgi:hypothetical protein